MCVACKLQHLFANVHVIQDVQNVKADKPGHCQHNVSSNVYNSSANQDISSLGGNGRLNIRDLIKTLLAIQSSAKRRFEPPFRRRSKDEVKTVFVFIFGPPELHTTECTDDLCNPFAALRLSLFGFFGESTQAIYLPFLVVVGSMAEEKGFRVVEDIERHRNQRKRVIHTERDFVDRQTKQNDSNRSLFRVCKRGGREYQSEYLDGEEIEKKDFFSNEKERKHKGRKRDMSGAKKRENKNDGIRADLWIH